MLANVKCVSFNRPCHKSVTIATSLSVPSQFQYIIIKSVTCSIPAGSLANISPVSPVKTTQNVYFFT